MKKFISFVVASAMVLSLVPATAFAASDARITNTVTVEEDSVLGSTVVEKVTDKVAPTLVLKASENFEGEVQEFRLKLANAEWNADTLTDHTIIGKDIGKDKGIEVMQQDGTTAVVGATVTVKSISDSVVTVSLTGATLKKDETVKIPMFVKATGGNATVEVQPLESEFTAETKTFAKTSAGATDFYTDSTKSFQDGGEINDLFIEEIVAGTITPLDKAGDSNEIRVKLNSGFEWKAVADAELVEGNGLTGTDGEKVMTAEIDSTDGKTIIIKFAKETTPSAKAALIKLSGLRIAEDGADFGSVAKVTVSGADTTRKTIEVGTYVDFGVTLTAAKKDLPVIYAGTVAKEGSDNCENILLKATIEETVQASWINDRKMTLTLPEGVEFVRVDDVKETNFTPVNDAKAPDEAVKDAIKADEDNVITLQGDSFAATPNKKRKLEINFVVSAKADFTGDIELVVSGPAVANEEMKVVLGKVVAPIEVKSPVNELKIDYRQTKVADFTIAEPAVGLWEKNDVIVLDAELMNFEDGIVAKVTKGDLEIKAIDVTKGQILVTVKSMSSREAGEITFSNVALNMDRTLAAGDYKLSVKGISNNVTTDKDKNVVVKEGNKFFMNNYVPKDGYTGYFDVDEIVALKDFVKVVTAGRDQDDATFTTKITVPVGSSTIMAGTKEITVDAPAYINKDGYTMLPVRAVVEALNGLAAIRWDDATKTVTITFGQRVISMTVGSKTMNINGVPTQLLAAPEITNSRAFLPLRDLGYALGLKDDKIAWDAATSTATLN